jgi:hypothetical protein
LRARKGVRGQRGGEESCSCSNKGGMKSSPKTCVRLKRARILETLHLLPLDNPPHQNNSSEYRSTRTVPCAQNQPHHAVIPCIPCSRINPTTPSFRIIASVLTMPSCCLFTRKPSSCAQEPSNYVPKQGSPTKTVEYTYALSTASSKSHSCLNQAPIGPQATSLIPSTLTAHVAHTPASTLRAR